MKIFLSAGEASGDRYAAAILNALNHLVKPVQAFAIGGKSLEKAGAKLIADSKSWGAIGIAQSLLVVPKVIPRVFQVKWFLAHNVGIFVAVDFGYLNVKLAKFAKKHGWRVLYFVPPGSWKKVARKTELAQICDAIVSPFPWNAEQLRGQGANAFFFGHPLAELIDDEKHQERFGIAILPGSRMHEILHNLPVMAKVIRKINPDKIWIPVAQNLDPNQLAEAWKRLAPEFESKTEFTSESGTALTNATAALVCSGSATLEAALCGCPHVIIYCFSAMMNLEYKIRRPNIEHIGMSNILAGERIFPELIQHEATCENISAALIPLLGESPERKLQLEAMQKIRSQALPKGCFEETAKLISSWK